MTTPASYETLDRDQLIQLLLARDLDVEANPFKKKYGLVWEDKPEQFDADSVGRIPVLKRDPTKCILSDPARPTHVLIEGDNYHALKVLTYTHERSVDVIYIDPPYNTGNKDFKYNDKFVDREDSYRHSKWLSFMAKRLRLAKTLLADDGVLLVSIDDNEQANLKLLLDSIFVEANYVGEFIWKTRGIKGAPKHGALIVQHEKVFAYAKSIAKFRFFKDAHPDAGSKQWLGYRKTGGEWKRSARPNQFFPFFYIVQDESLSLHRPSEDTEFVEIFPRDTKGDDGFWHNFPATAQDKLDDKLLRARKVKGRWVIEYLETKKDEIAFGSLLEEIPSSRGSTELADFGLTGFNNPKPVDLVSTLLKRCLDKPKGVVLDFFAGSGTTAQAVMQLNAQDSGSRQCILVTNDEGEFNDETGSPLEGGICQHVTYPRLKKTIRGYEAPEGKKIAGLGENLAFFKTEFVEDRALERHRRELSVRSDDLLCLRESCFVEEKSTDKRWRSFTDSKGKRLVVVSDQYASEDLRPVLMADKRPTVLYAFRFGDDDEPSREYGGKGLEHVSAKPVPDSLLALHRRIAKQEAA